MDADVIVVGAGLAGLRAAQVLTAAGRRAIVLEAQDRVGGRVRTDQVDGFLVDRGFQLLNPAYTELRAALDPASLRLHAFGRGVAVRDGSRLRVIADPTRNPAGALRGVLGGGYLNPTQLARLATWAAGPQARTETDEPLAASFDRVGFDGPSRELVEVFLAGVLADAHGQTSAAFARSLVAWFLRGTPSLPAAGMTALPQRLAAGLHVRLSHRVGSLARGSDGVTLTTPGGRLGARAVIIAVDPVDLGLMLGRPASRMSGLATWWFATEQPPSRLPYLHVDAGRLGPIVNTAVVSNVAPSYAPIGQHLVQCSAVLDGATPSEQEVRRHASSIYGVPTNGWALIARHEITRTLPFIAPGAPRQQSDLGGGVFVAGDHVEGASIQHALMSGRRAGKAALKFLHDTR